MITVLRKIDNLIEWNSMRKSTDGTFENLATVTFTVYSGYSRNTATGALTTPSTNPDVNQAVSGATSVTMSYVTGSNGKYQGFLSKDVQLSLTADYTIEITAVSASGSTRVRAIAMNVVDGTT